MKHVSRAQYNKYLKAWKKGENEKAEEDKRLWRSYLQDIESIQNLPPVQKAETWLRQVMIKGKSFLASLDWVSQFTISEFVDQEALVYFISRGVDCADQIKSMSLRLKENKRKSEEFYKSLETQFNNRNRSRGSQPKKARSSKNQESSSYFELMQRRSFSLANDDQSYQVASMIRTIEWGDIGGFDVLWKEYANSLNEDVNRGGEIGEEIASQTLFHICRSDFAIQVMQKNLLKLLDIIEMPDHQLTIPWHRWNRDDFSRSAGIDRNSIFAYAASIAFANARLRARNFNKDLVDEAIQWLMENQEKSGAWKVSTILNEPSIMGTCMVIHALAINKPRGWKLAVSQACDWLISKQDVFGFWYESPTPPVDPVYLTVLVLDTLDFLKKSPILTFRMDEKSNNPGVTTQININGSVSGSTIIIGNDNTVENKKE
jgi:hypothetical protein